MSVMICKNAAPIRIIVPIDALFEQPIIYDDGGVLKQDGEYEVDEYSSEIDQHGQIKYYIPAFNRTFLAIRFVPLHLLHSPDLLHHLELTEKDEKI